MKSNALIQSADVVSKNINSMRQALMEIDQKDHQDKETLQAFNAWRIQTSKLLSELFTDGSIRTEFLNDTKILANKFSQAENTIKLDDAMERAKHFLERLNSDVSLTQYEKRDDDIDKPVALLIIRRLLKNFYKHIEAMYQAEVHGRGTLKKIELEKIKIRNEYDVQRMLYALIRPIFPLARLEAVDDAEYRAIRYDIVLSEYDIVIEVKCTRETMTERKLTEELGADSFHYKAQHVFFFIFDRVKLIKNVDAFEKAFNRGEKDVGKSIETIVIQESIFH